MPVKNYFPIFVWLLIVGLLPAPTGSAADAPAEIGGFRIGAPIARYADRVRMETAMPIRHRECLMEVEVEPPDGFRSGTILYGVCTGEDRILRVTLKYEDPSRRFFETLLNHCKERFGKPDEWKGDPFHVLIAWKWFFADAEGRRVSLILQHNRRDSDRKMGNAVKLTASDLMAEEMVRSRTDGAPPDEPPRRRDPSAGTPNWETLIPK